MQPCSSSFSEIEVLYRQHGAALLLFAVSICGERSRAQDVVQQVFLKFVETGSLRNAADAKSYVFTSVRNAAINESKSRQRNVSIDDEQIWFEPPSRDYAAELNLRHALQALPDDQREAVVLHVWGDLTFAQIAEVLGINASTAASRYRYALAKLREHMSSKERSCANS